MILQMLVSTEQAYLCPRQPSSDVRHSMSKIWAPPGLEMDSLAALSYRCFGDLLWKLNRKLGRMPLQV